MKHHQSSSPGVALIIVLGFLVIITALAVAFFSSVTTELKASRNFAAGVTTHQLADSAVQIVMGQIAAATTRGITATGVGTEVWASQPGMIRVYGTSTGASSSADAFYKLYSSNKMILTAAGGDLGSFNPQSYTQNDDCYSGWNTAPALWADLNAPVLVADPAGGSTPVPRFPIIDPRSYAVPGNVTGTWTGNVEGFTYTTAMNQTVAPGSTPDSLHGLPMPVRWVYVLQDGTLLTPDAGGTTAATFSTASAVLKQSNPIVGRIAFWTDDETSKLNLNTAAGFTENLANLPNSSSYSASSYAGSFWDTPRFYTQFDYGLPDSTGHCQAGAASGGLALCQLLQFEFQRYPGHPATTSLAPALKDILTSEQLYSVLPRYSNLNLSGVAASTMGGTNRVIVDPTTPATSLDSQEIQPKQDRLYASLDEFLLGAKSRTSSYGQPGFLRSTNNQYASLSSNPITPQVVDSLRFFLTTQSRSPELNLWGQPRVGAWPVRSELSTETSGLNVYDNLIVFCATIGNSAAANGRPDTKTNNSATGVYRYLFTRREVTPGSSTTLVTHQPDPLNGNVQKQYEFSGTASLYTADCLWPRNQYLLGTYLPQFLTSPIPGVGTAMSAKYDGYDQQNILAEIFDYIRVANSHDTTTTITTGTAIPFAPRGYVPPSSPPYMKFNNVQAKGFGRMSTLCEVTLDFYYAGPQMGYTGAIPSGAPLDTGWSKWDPANAAKRYAAIDPTDKKVIGGYMRAFLLFSTFDPMQGYAPKFDPAISDPKLSIECRWPQGDWQVVVPAGTLNMGFLPTPATNNSLLTTTVNRSGIAYWGGRHIGGYEGFMHTLNGGPITTITPSSLNWVAPYKIMWDPTHYLTSSDVGSTAAPQSKNNAFTTIAAASVATAGTGGVPLEEYYPFQTSGTTVATALIGGAIPIPGPHVIAPTDPKNTFAFKPGSDSTKPNLIVKLYYGSSSSTAASNSSNPALGALQEFDLYFPPSLSNAGWPIPQGPPSGALNAVAAGVPSPPTADVTTWALTPKGTSSYTDMANWYWTGTGAFFDDVAAGRATVASPGVYAYYTSLQASWSFATRLAWCTAPVNGPGQGGASYNPYSSNESTTAPAPIVPGYFADRWRCIVQPGDTVRSLLYWNATNGSGGQIATSTPQATYGGDLRIGQLTPVVNGLTDFREHPDYLGSQSRACVLRGGDGTRYFPLGAQARLLIGTAASQEATLGNHIPLQQPEKFQESRAFANLPWSGGANPKVMVNGVVRRDSGGIYQGDFDNGLGDFADGPYLNKQDEGNVIYAYLDYSQDPSNPQKVYPVPYFTHTWSYEAPGNTFTSPSRQMPSPAMFGSLPSQVNHGGTGTGYGWQTLAFSPNTAGINHPGNKDPKDHYLLDLFMTPVVEPYPISEPFSTAGKVNLNYRIAPFDYIRRSTALRGALYSVRVTAVPSQSGTVVTSANYGLYKIGQSSNATKLPDGSNLPLTQNFRIPLNRDMTIQSFDGLYDAAIANSNPNTGFFTSATQICERWLYPNVGSNISYSGPASEATNMQTWWKQNGDLTGDNEREKPYVDLYPRITTKSNTYTVHMKVQTLRQLPHPTDAGYLTWTEGKDTVLAEYRGSTTIERYVDPSDSRFLPATSNSINPDTKSVEPLYRFRTVINKKFSP